VLSDEAKRADYDRYGKDGAVGGSPGGDYAGYDEPFRGRRSHMSFRHAEDIFKAFFGGRVRALSCENGASIGFW
jgi:DnaJ-class molecular chaperone